MKITNETRIQEIKEEFHNSFPGLKLEFYNHSHEAFDGSAKSDQVADDSVLLSELKGFQTGEITFDPQLTTKQFEEQFENHMHLHVQVFRRSNKMWLQTSATDSWTLETQNRKGLHSVQ